MQQSKLINLLRQLDKRQLARVGEAVLSPYFNKSKDIVRFYQYVSRFAPLFNQPELSKTSVLAHLKLSTPVDEHRLQYLMSDLVMLVENVLLLEHVSRNEPARLISLAQTFAEIGLPDRTRQVLTKLGEFWKNTPIQWPERLAMEFAAAKIWIALADRDHRTFDPTLQSASDHLSAYFLVEKLQLLTAMTNVEQVLKVQYKQDWEIENIESIASKSDHPLVQLWLLAFRLSRYDQPEDYRSFKQILFNQTEKLRKGDLRHLTAAALNFCTRRINRDADEHYYGEYIGLYKILINNELILENGYISPWLYKNIVTAGLKTNELAWTRQFIESFRRNLPADFAESMYAYNLGHLFYHEKKHTDAQQALARVEFRDPLLSISARSLLIKIYVETGQDDLLFAALEAARVWLLRNQAVTPGLRQQFQKFVETTGKMARLLPRDHQAATRLLENLPPSTNILHRDWLAGQLNSLQK
ncbi:MAG: hypothetical protein JNN28_11305 [Saprospiraceae bacterium]|nr:hypothetical protein [Saprospiraceae bacterium]